MSIEVVALGALNLDLIYAADLDPLGLEMGRERVGSPEEFKDLLVFLNRRGKLKVRSGGGSAANAAYALARWGISTGVVGKVGQDEEGDFLLQDLRRAGVDISRVTRGEKSGQCIIVLGKKKNRSIVILPGANDTLSYPEIDLDYINKAKFLHMSSFLGKIPYQAQKMIVARTRARVSFDPGEPHAIRGIDELAPIFKHCFILFPSDREIEIITGKGYREGARELLEYGIGIIACTLGEKGSYVLSKDVELEVPPFQTKVVDTTGAGDVYAAGFLAGLLKDLSLIRCADVATKVASSSIASYGRPSYPDAKALERILEEET